MKMLMIICPETRQQEVRFEGEGLRVFALPVESLF